MSELIGWTRPRTAGELHAWVREALEIEVPRRPLIAGHAAPFDYLCHAFFEEDEHLAADPRAGADEHPDATARDCVVWANRGGGKTFLGALATLADMVFKPGIAIRILGGSLDQSRRMHEHLASFLAREALAELVDGRVTLKRARLSNGSVCEVLAQSQTSVRGTRVQKLRCDEVELFDPEIWEAAQLVTRSKQCGDVYVRGAVEALSTMHQPHGLMFRIVRESEPVSGVATPDGRPMDRPRRRLFRWGVVDVLDRCPDPEDESAPEPGTFACRWTDASGIERACPLLDECRGQAKARDARGDPAGFIAVDDATRLKSRVSQATWESEMLCLRPSRSDAVLPEFSAREHVVGALPALCPDETEASEWVAGMDFGFRAPTVVIRARSDPDGTLWVVHERVTTGELLRDHIGVLRAPIEVGPSAGGPSRGVGTVEPPAWVGVDPAGRQRSEQTGLSNIQQMRKAGLVVRDRLLRLDEGLGLIRTRLRPAGGGPPRLYVHERCESLIESLERYHYPADDKESMTPVKDGSDHAVDALRYLVQNLDRPIRTSLSRYV